MKKEYLALFDLDGTLFDTSEVNYFAYKDALEPFGIKLQKSFFVEECNGRHYMEFLPKLMGDMAHIEEVHKNKKAAYWANLNMARENRQLFKMIEGMKGYFYTAVVTTASRQNTLDILKYFNREEMFDFLITHEDTTKTKPDPQGFFLGMSHFGIDAAHTVIFEDSNVGIKAAQATGAAVIVINKF